MKNTEKHRLWCIVMGGFALCLLANYGFDQSTSWLWILCSTGFVFSCLACANIVASSMLSDIADFGAVRFYLDRGTIYFAFLTLAMKITMGIGSGFAVWLINYFGFEVSAAEQSADAIFGIKLGFSLLPAMMVGVAIMIAIFYPITLKRHTTIQIILERKRPC